MLVNGVRVGVDRRHVGGHHFREIAQAVEVDIHHHHVAPDARRHVRRVGAHHAAAEDQHFARLHARHAAEQNAAPHRRPLQILGAFLNRHAPRHFAHRREQRQAAFVVGQRFICHRGDPRIQTRLGQMFVRGEVEVGEHHLALAHERQFFADRLFDLDDHLRLREDLGMVIDKLRPAALYCSSV